MGTPNFIKSNFTKNYYIVENDRIEFVLMDIEEVTKNYPKLKDVYFYDDFESTNDRNYPFLKIGKIDIYEELERHYTEDEIINKLQKMGINEEDAKEIYELISEYLQFDAIIYLGGYVGYYEGINLDLLVMSGGDGNYIDDLDEIFKSWSEFYDDEIRKILSNYDDEIYDNVLDFVENVIYEVKNNFKDEIFELIEEIEKVYKDVADCEAICLGVASNGEAFYQCVN